jgi:CheY-like chemotaxis protein
VSRRTLRARLENLGVTVDEADALDAGVPRLAEGTFGVCLVDRELVEQAAPELRVALERSQVKIVSLGMLGRRPMPVDGVVKAFASLNKPVRQVPLIACLAEAAMGGDAAPRSQADRPSDAGWGTGMRILVAEDNPVNQRIAVRLVEKFGFQADVAVNGLEALAATAACQYAAVLMDGEMPVLDGLEATRQIRQRDEPLGLRVPIIAMTASGMSGDRERFLAAGMDEYVTKPISSERLGELLTRFVRGAEATR